MPGDILFIVGGTLPFCYIAWVGVRRTVRRVTLQEPSPRSSSPSVRESDERDPRRGCADGRLRGLPAGLRRRAGPAGPAHPSAVRAVPHRGLCLPLRARPLGLPGGPAAVAPRVRPRPPALRYRAKPSICNACPTKHRCTTSQDGREITRPLDPWPHSEAGRFHRGIALVLVALAGFVLVVEAIRHHEPAGLALLGVVAASAGALGWWLTGHLRRTPTNFPEPAPAHGLRLAASDAGRRTRWGFGTRSMR